MFGLGIIDIILIKDSLGFYDTSFLLPFVLNI